MGDGAWDLQRKLLMTEYGEGERGVVGLLEKLIAVRRGACQRRVMRLVRVARVVRVKAGGLSDRPFLPPFVPHAGAYVCWFYEYTLEIARGFLDLASRATYCL